LLNPPLCVYDKQHSSIINRLANNVEKCGAREESITALKGVVVIIELTLAVPVI
jgi:hypothetical protein